MNKLMMVMMVAMTAATALAETSFSYQGALKMANGAEVADKTKTIQFRLYASPTDEAALWGRSVTVRLDDKGLFNVALSDGAGSAIKDVNGTGLDGVFAANVGKLYIGLTVEGSTGEIRPRQKVLSVPTASFAEDVATAKSDFTVSGNAIVHGGLSVEKTLEVKGGLSVKEVSVGTGGLNVGGSLIVSSGNKLTLAADAKLEVANGASIVNASGQDMFKLQVGVPSGAILMWSGSANAIPEGWALCNGENGTPDLRGRFIVGAGLWSSDYTAGDGVDRGYSVGDRGGENVHTLTVAEMPSHKHELTGYRMRESSTDSDDDELEVYARDAGGAPQTSYAGGNASHENRPPYFALCFIMKK